MITRCRRAPVKLRDGLLYVSAGSMCRVRRQGRVAPGQLRGSLGADFDAAFRARPDSVAVGT